MGDDLSQMWGFVIYLDIPEEQRDLPFEHYWWDWVPDDVAQPWAGSPGLTGEPGWVPGDDGRVMRQGLGYYDNRGHFCPECCSWAPCTKPPGEPCTPEVTACYGLQCIFVNARACPGWGPDGY